jgi:hypothetical protein
MSDQQDPKKPTNNENLNNSISNMMDQARSTLKNARATFERNVRTGVHESVHSANKLLASLEKQTSEVSKPVAQGLQRVQQEVVPHWTQQAVRVYEQRLDYGPQLVAGSTVLVGSWVALRRGKIPAAFYGTLAGSLAYLIVYDPPVPPLEDVADWIFGEKK